MAGRARLAGVATKESLHQVMDKQERKDLKSLADDFCLLHRPEVQEILGTCKSYAEGQQKLMRVYETVYM